MDMFPTKDSPYAFSTSVIVHILIVVALFFLVSWEVPDPPIGELSVDMELAADWGQSFQGQGNQDTENPSPQENVSEEAASSSETEPVEEDAVVTENNSPVTTPKTEKPKVEKPKTQPEKPQQKPSDGLNDALDQLKNPGGGGDGTSEEPGDEGKEDGNISGKGVFGGNGGGGGWSLEGRGMTSNPKLDEDPKQAGTVVLDIIVDRNGKVISAKPNISKSKTTSSYLFDLAVKAALTAKFSVKSDAPVNQKGELTFNFKLQ
ncbi:MAG: hypothetical protein JNM00_12355 [Flavobacteriales bacterium]|nr:hypothetical protein [Flavobacteriales bacterium]